MRVSDTITTRASHPIPPDASCKDPGSTFQLPAALSSSAHPCSLLFARQLTNHVTCNTEHGEGYMVQCADVTKILGPSAYDGHDPSMENVFRGGFTSRNLEL